MVRAGRGGLELVRLPGDRLAGFIVGDPRSAGLLDRLHRRPGVAFAVAVLRRSRTAGRVLSGLSPVGGPARGAVRDLVAVLRHEWPDAASLALTCSLDVRWATVAVLRDSGETVFVKASGDGGLALAAEHRFLSDARGGLPDVILAPETIGPLVRHGRWTLAAFSDVRPTPGERTVSGLEDVLPFLIAIRALSEALTPYEDVFAVPDGEERPAAVRRLHRLLAPERGGLVTTTLSHGDLTPWNFDLRAGTMRLWDWEYATPAAPWPHDAIHFVLQTRRFARREALPVALEGAMEDIRRHASSLGMGGGGREIASAFGRYALHRLMTQRRLGHDGDDARGLVDAMADILDARPLAEPVLSVAEPDQ